MKVETHQHDEMGLSSFKAEITLYPRLFIINNDEQKSCGLK